MGFYLSNTQTLCDDPMLQTAKFIQDHLCAKARAEEAEGCVVRQGGVRMMQPGQKRCFIRKDFHAFRGHYCEL